jgi:hypothetical protein
MDGGVVSSMVKVAEVVEALLQSSVAVKITVAEPVAPHKSESAVKLLDQITLLQASVAIAPPLLASQALSADVLPDPSQATVWSDAGVPIVGAVVSSIVKIPEVVEVFPHASVAVNITVAEPVAPHKSESPV